MKKFFYLMTAMLCAAVSANAQVIDASKANGTKEKKSVLVAYFSVTGNTKKVATELAAAVGADAWEIIPLVPYTEEDLDYKNPKSRSTIEMQDPYERPTIKMCTDIRSYKVIFLGFPIWWGVCPKIINSWIENNDLTGKIMVPFATSGSSQIAPAVEYLRKTYPDYTWDDGKLLNSYPDGFLKEWTSKYIK
ncbi:MAG: flavodoxin [Paludibacteraceae bacterium]|nr:flavodoxin [Paludibacteraceae bacterium]